MLLTKNSVAHDTVPYFMERFRDAYTTQLQNFAQNVLQQRTPPITIEDGLEALRIGVAATRAHETGGSVVGREIRRSKQSAWADPFLGPLHVRCLAPDAPHRL